MRKIVLPQQKYLPMTSRRVLSRQHQKNLTCHTRQPKHKGNTPTFMYTCKNVHKTLEVAVVLVHLRIPGKMAISNQILITVRHNGLENKTEHPATSFSQRREKNSRDTWIARRLLFFFSLFLKTYGWRLCNQALPKTFHERTTTVDDLKFHLHGRRKCRRARMERTHFSRTHVHIQPVHTTHMHLRRSVPPTFFFLHIPQELGHLAKQTPKSKDVCPLTNGRAIRNKQN